MMAVSDNAAHPTMKTLRYLFVHQGWASYAIEWHTKLSERHCARGYDVIPFCAVPRAPAPRCDFAALDRMWGRRHPDIVRLHDQLVETAKGCDVLINFNGANIHPEWLPELDTFNVYICWDDPESSAVLSEPVAKYFDYSFTGNCACQPLYQSWGVKRCDFLPFAAYEGEYDPALTVQRILSGNREIDVAFLGERESPWRQARLDRVQTAFPQFYARGRGWPHGSITKSQCTELYARTKIGVNIHNSVGPVNLRTFVLPANGVLQICDNKCRLGQLFDLDKEVVGYDTIEECIDLVRHYLSHDQERREIAARGFERVMRDYTEEKQWDHILTTIAPLLPLKKEDKLDTPVYSEDCRKRLQPVTRQRLARCAKHIANATLRRVGCEIRRVPTVAVGREPSDEDMAATVDSLSHKGGERNLAATVYQENEEIGAANLSEKVGRVATGGFFEWPNIVALNWVVAGMVGSARRIAELGGGTGCFALEVAADPKRWVVSSELDHQAHEWAVEHRSRANIEYVNRPLGPQDGVFDLVVSIDVIEHVRDYCDFLQTCCSLAPKAILTTPNKNRDAVSAVASPPAYHQHVREWTCGEFYWVLRAFYGSVKMYSLPNVYVPIVVPVSIVSTMTPLVAVCEMPLCRERRAL